MENVPQTATEEQSCVLKVLGFNCSGMNDVVKNKEIGLLVKTYEIKDLANRINKITFNKNLL